jgi:hypothetical protein
MATREEAVFCKIAVKNNLLTPEQCQECEQLRKQAGGDKGLIDVIIEKGYISAKVALAIFKAQVDLAANAGKRPVKEMKEGESSLNLAEPGPQPAVPDNQATLQGEIINENTPTPLFPATPQPGDESYERIKRDMGQIPLGAEGAKSAENVVYNINIRNFQSTEGNKTGEIAEPPKPTDGALVPYNAGLTLRRNDLTEEQLLALLRGQSVNLPAKLDPAAQMPVAAMPHVLMQHNILTAVRQNLLITMLGLAIIAAITIVGLIVIGKMGQGPGTITVVNSGQQNPGPAPVQPTLAKPDTPMMELMARLEAGTSSIMKIDAAKEIGRRAASGEDAGGIKSLVKALKDNDAEVLREIKFQLRQFKLNPDIPAPLRAQLLNDTYTTMSVMFGEYDTTFKDNCIAVLKSMETPEADMLTLLTRGVKDGDPRARGNSITALVDYTPASTISLVAPLALDADPAVRAKARTFLWDKGVVVKDQTPLLTALNNSSGNAALLNEFIDYLWAKKDVAFNGRIVLFIAHPDANIKTKIITLLQQMGPEADQYFGDPNFVQAFIQVRDATVTAQPPNPTFRTAMVNTLGAIHGLKTGDLILWHAEYDPDANILKLAQGLLASFPPDIPKRYQGWLEVEKRKLIDAQKGRIAAAMDLLAKGNLDEFYKQAEAILGDQPNTAFIDLAFAEIADVKDRATFNAKYLDARSRGGWVFIIDPMKLLPQPPPPPNTPPPPPPQKTWVKVGDAFEILRKGAEALAADPNYKFAEALKVLKEMPPEVLAMPDIPKAQEVAIKNLQTLADGYVKQSVDQVKDLVSKEKFPEADAKLKELEGKFLKESFSAAYKTTSDARADYVRVFRQWRSQIMILTGSESPEDIFKRFGVVPGKLTPGALGAHQCMVMQQDRSLTFDLDPKRKGVVNINFVWTLAINPPRDCREFLSLGVHIDAPSNSTITIEVRCGQIIYRASFNNSGDLVMNLDNSTRQVQGFGQVRQTIDAITFTVTRAGNPREPSNPRVSISNIVLSGKNPDFKP